MARTTNTGRSDGALLDGAALHVLVVDDDRRLRDLLKKYLTGNGYRVTTAEDGQDAREKLRGLAFDAIVLDVMMPGETGVELARSLRQTSDVPILMLTAMGEAEDRIAGLESGADDYLPKPFEPRELILRIGSIMRRGGAHNVGPSTPDALTLGEYMVDPARGELRHGAETIKLTDAESSLLKILAESPGITFSRAELGRRTAGGRERSIDVQIARLRRKLERDPKSPRFLKTVRGKGYVLWPD